MVQIKFDTSDVLLDFGLFCVTWLWQTEAWFCHLSLSSFLIDSALMISLCVQAQLSFKLSDQNTVFVKSVISTVCRDSSQSCTDTRGLFISQIRMCPIYFLLSETFYLLYHMFINCVILTVALPFYLSFMSVCCLMCDDSLILCTWILVNSSPTPPILLLWSKHLNGSQSDISGFYEPLRLKSFIQGRSTVQKSQGTQMSLYFFLGKQMQQFTERCKNKWECSF